MSDLPLSRTDKSTFPPRTPWRPGFPEVVIHATVAARDRHADYAAAKAGDAGSALTLSRDLLSRVAIDTLESLVGAPGAVLLPVTAVELAGFNAIPDAMAQIIALTLGWRLSAGEVLQNNRVGHTRAAAFNRFVTPAAFDGPVEADSNYVLVDDHVGLGGTLANLKGYIESAGGRVVAMTTLTESREARHIALHSTNLEMLRMRHGEELEKFWTEQFGYGLDCLTNVEGAILRRELSVDSIRNRLAQGAVEARGRGLLPAVGFDD